MTRNETLGALIVHGSYGTPEENWFPWLRTRLEKAGISVAAPHFPTPEGQDLDSWRQVLDTEVGQITEGCLLFGHSLGVAFLLDVLERSTVQAGALFSVSGFTGLLGLDEFDSVNRTFVEREFDWPRIRSAVRQSFVYQGEDDPYVPQRWGQFLTEALGAERRVIPKGGHLNLEAGYDHFDLLWKDVEKVLPKPPL
jgi:predicted alpha/beta hydrolase family esterase